MWKSARRQTRNCPGMELNGQSLEIEEMFYVSDKIGA